MSDIVKLMPRDTAKNIPMPEYNYSPLPLDGMELRLTPYWHDRINQNDVYIDAPEVIVEADKNIKKTNKEV